MILKIKKLSNDAVIPKYQSSGAAAFDLHIVGDCVVDAGKRMLVHTGLAVEIPVGYCLLLSPRSGLAASYGITIVNSPAIIDSDYRGEIMVILHNCSESRYIVPTGDRIAQARLCRAEYGDIVEVSTLSDTERGKGGLGSTGRD